MGHPSSGSRVTRHEMRSAFQRDPRDWDCSLIWVGWFSESAASPDLSFALPRYSATCLWAFALSRRGSLPVADFQQHRAGRRGFPYRAFQAPIKKVVRKAVIPQLGRLFTRPRVQDHVISGPNFIVRKPIRPEGNCFDRVRAHVNGVENCVVVQVHVGDGRQVQPFLAGNAAIDDTDDFKSGRPDYHCFAILPPTAPRTRIAPTMAII